MLSRPDSRHTNLNEPVSSRRGLPSIRTQQVSSQGRAGNPTPTAPVLKEHTLKSLRLVSPAEQPPSLDAILNEFSESATKQQLILLDCLKDALRQLATNQQLQTREIEGEARELPRHHSYILHAFVSSLLKNSANSSVALLPSEHWQKSGIILKRMLTQSIENLSADNLKGDIHRIQVPGLFNESTATILEPERKAEEVLLSRMIVQGVLAISHLRPWALDLLLSECEKMRQKTPDKQLHFGGKTDVLLIGSCITLIDRKPRLERLVDSFLSTFLPSENNLLQRYKTDYRKTFNKPAASLAHQEGQNWRSILKDAAKILKNLARTIHKSF